MSRNVKTWTTLLFSRFLQQIETWIWKHLCAFLPPPVYCLWPVAYLWLTMTAQLGWIFLIYGQLLCNVGEMSPRSGAATDAERQHRLGPGRRAPDTACCSLGSRGKARALNSPQQWAWAVRSVRAVTYYWWLGPALAVESAAPSNTQLSLERAEYTRASGPGQPPQDTAEQRLVGSSED